MSETFRSEILSVASSLIGTRSRKYENGAPEFGQTTDDGFDCSGFVKHVLRESGLHVPCYIGQDGKARYIRHANEFWDHYGLFIHEEVKQPGDLIFFSRKGDFPTHIGFVYDQDSFIHSPGTNGGQVEILPIIDEAIAVSGIGRTLYVRNPIGYKTPAVSTEIVDYRYNQRAID